jgi:hypothetical protein
MARKRKRERPTEVAPVAAPSKPPVAKVAEPKPPPAAPRQHRVLVERADGSGFEFVDATPEQALAYVNGDPRWRNAEGSSSWASRSWLRIFGR